MKALDCVILEQKKIAENIFSLKVLSEYIAKNAVAGQFCSILVDNFPLRRPISICNADKENNIVHFIYQAKGNGTKKLSSLVTGVKLNILGPLGNGFDISETDGKNILIIGGGIGTPPLLKLALDIKNSQNPESITVSLGFRNKDLVILQDEFSKIADTFIYTEDGSCGEKGYCTSVFDKKDFDLVFSCGPKPLLKAIQKKVQNTSVKAYLSTEEHMACSIGACLGCNIAILDDSEIGYHYERVCKDGPVFLADKIKFD